MMFPGNRGCHGKTQRRQAEIRHICLLPAAIPEERHADQQGGTERCSPIDDRMIWGKVKGMTANVRAIKQYPMQQAIDGLIRVITFAIFPHIRNGVKIIEQISPAVGINRDAQHHGGGDSDSDSKPPFFPNQSPEEQQAKLWLDHADQAD